MNNILHITSGDSCGGCIARSGVPGEVFVWHDILYDGPRKPGWPDEETMESHTHFLVDETGDGLDYSMVLDTMHAQYAKLKTLASHDGVVLWFDACLFDQAMLCHLLTCMRLAGYEKGDLLCVDFFPGIVPYNGLGEMTPAQLASVYGRRRPLTPSQFSYAERVDRAFAFQDQASFRELAVATDAPIPWIPAAVARWLQEQPDPATGRGRLEQLALDAIRAGCSSPEEIFACAAAHDTPPQFWGDTTLWAKVNALANRTPPLVRIEGPLPRLPQWNGVADLKLFRVVPTGRH